MDDDASFGHWLQRRRKALRLSCVELARRVGCATVTLRKIEADERRPSEQIAAKLAEHLYLAPLERTTFIKAVRELLLHSDARLLTLTGAPGIGKTRLALRAVAELHDAFADGVVFVSLAPIRDPELVLATIARALELTELPGQPVLERLQTYLRDRQTLLVLDNFEQVLKAAPQLAELLAARARALAPGFAMTDANATAVATICTALDGLPLAIELAAARVAVFTPQEVLARLDQRFALLIGGAVDLQTRQQTLRRAIDWSYELLGAREQALFWRLGVFVGGCTLEAASAVCDSLDGEPGDPSPKGHLRREQAVEIEVFDGIAALIDKSLLQREARTDG